MKKLLVLLLVLMMVLSFAACGDKKNDGGDSAATSVTVTDMKGREVTIEGEVTKVVAITASDCEILFALGAGDLIVGRGEYCNYPEEVNNITAVGSGGETNAEEIIALEPQVVFMNEMAQSEEQIGILEAAGIKVIISDAATIEETYTSIELIGKVIGCETEAAAMIDSMKTAFTELEAKAPKDGTETIYFEVSPLEWGLWTAGSGTFMNEIADMLGLTNIFEDQTGWVQISEEQVIERNPDYIVTIMMYYGEGPTPEEEIIGRTGWGAISAIANNKVISIDSDSVSRPGPRLADAANAMYDAIYGE